MNISIVIAEIMRRDRPRPRLPLDDCLSYKDGKCTALTEMMCKEYECKFYKYTKEEIICK